MDRHLQPYILRVRFKLASFALARPTDARLVLRMPNSLNSGLETSTQEPEVCTALNDFYEKLMGLRQGVEGLLDVAKRFPDEPTLHLACAFFWLFGQTPEAQRVSGQHLELADKLQSALNPRELAWLGALQLLHSRDFDAAASAFEEITKTWPEDLPALRAAEFVYYVIGQQFSGARFRAHTERLFARHSEDPDFLAIHAFANELCGDKINARHHAELALELREINPWAQHALEHVLLWEGNADEASRLMESWLVQWPQVGRTIHCHNAWHMALMHLDRLETQRAFEVYDAHIWGITPDMVIEQLDAIAFLWRAEMAGLTIDSKRWEAIAPHIRPVCETLFMPFATAHYAYALARVGDEDTLGALLHKTTQRAAAEDAEALRVWKPVGLGIVQGSAWLGRGKAKEAANAFDPVMPNMTRIGGSDAQDDLFRFAYLESLQSSGRHTDAQNYLKNRLAQKPASALESKLLTNGASRL